MADIRAEPAVEISFVLQIIQVKFETKEFTTAGSALISAIKGWMAY